jgi:hypothetical protein
MIPANAISALVESIQCQAEGHDDFLPLRARVERHAKFVCRHLPAADRDDFVSESVASAFQSFLRLKIRGKDPEKDFPGRMAHWAVLVVMDGRHLSGTDALSQRAQRRHGFRVESLSVSSDERKPGPNELRPGDSIGDSLSDNTRTLPSEQAIFRIDFRNWLKTWGPKDRGLIDDLVLGERTADVASKHRISAGRVSQKRRQFRDDWERYCDEPSTEEDDRDFAA